MLWRSSGRRQRCGGRLVAIASLRVPLLRKNMFAESGLLAEGKLRGAMRFAALAAFLSTFPMLGDCKTATAGNELRQLEIQLKSLRSAKEIILMIVPRGVSF